MLESGKVIEVKGDKAFVMIERTQACDSCGSKGLCNSLSGGRNDGRMEVRNSLNVQAGDDVIVEIKSSAFLKSAFSIYLLPVFFLFIGIYSGSLIADYFNFEKDTVAIISGFVLLILSFLIIKFFNRQGRRNRQIPEIIKINKNI